MADPRLSGDSETAPLLRDPEAEDALSEVPDQTFLDRVHAIAQEPLTPLTKALLVVCLVLLLFTSIFVGLYAGVQHKLNTSPHHDGPPVTTTVTISPTASVSTSAAPGPTAIPGEPVCLTSECIILSASMLSSLDTSQDPCENFYEFANGGWLNSHPLPADKGDFGQFAALDQQNKQVIQHILESESSTSSFTTSYDEQILLKLRNFYHSCLNEDKLAEVGSQPLVHLIRTVRNLYNGTNKETSPLDDEKSSGLTAAVAFLHSRGVDALFSFNIEGDIGVDPNSMVLWFSQPGLGLPSKEYYQEESVLKIYRSVIEDLLLALAEEEEVLIGRAMDHDKTVSLPSLVDQDDAWPPFPWPPWGDSGDDDDKKSNKTEVAHKLAKKVLEFETRLAAASLDLDVLQLDAIATYNPVPLSNLTESLKQIDFSTYFSTFNTRTFPEQVISTYPSYVSSLSRILANTSSDTIEAYLVIRAALSLSPYLSTTTPAWQAQRTLVETLTGIKKGAIGDRAEYCVGKVGDVLGFAAGRYFVNATSFGGSSRDKGIKIITDIIDSFKQSLSNIEWMDKESAKAAAEKADAIRVKVGFPLSPDTRSSRSIASYYAPLKIDKDQFFENILNGNAVSMFKSWLQLGQKRNLEAWEMTPIDVNAYFNPPANEIVFPAGILQSPFFSEGWPGYLSYGAFGHVAAHELTHAFDSTGRLYNQQGKLEQWWTNSTSEGFNKKQECIVNQFSKYSIDDGKGGKIHVNGNLTSGENIGDTGLIQAYRTWKAQFNSSREAGTEYLLPGLSDHYSRDQLFFLAFAQIWARTLKPETAVQRIRTDPHSPSIYRVEGTVSNIPAFAMAFNCSKKSKLNPPPEKQCVFW
ncbi:Metalloprotease [Mycena floridula]|nr:Metalloprotease [Mycena floridula]